MYVRHFRGVEGRVYSNTDTDDKFKFTIKNFYRLIFNYSFLKNHHNKNYFYYNKKKLLNVKKKNVREQD